MRFSRYSAIGVGLIVSAAILAKIGTSRRAEAVASPDYPAIAVSNAAQQASADPSQLTVLGQGISSFPL